MYKDRQTDRQTDRQRDRGETYIDTKGVHTEREATERGKRQIKIQRGRRE
jgi:hypothetical protein